MKRTDELHRPLPAVEPYLERIGADKYTGPDLENLDYLIACQQKMVPFEALEVLIDKKPVVLDISVLYEKVVTRKRGGYCFEQNMLFAQLLEDLGYKVNMVFCRIERGQTIIRPCLHCAVIVDLPDGKYFCDVGYGGPMPGFSIKIEDGSEKTKFGEHFGISKEDEYWWTVWRITSEGEKEDVLQFNLFPQSRVEFIPASAYCSSPAAIFARMMMVNRRTETGHVSITDKTFRIEDGDTVTDEIIEDEERLREVLKQYFMLEGVL